MYSKTFSAELLEDDGSIRAVVALPVRGELGLAYASSLLIALLVGVCAGGGLWLASAIYTTEEVRLAFLPVDLFHLVVGLPVLLGSMWLARRGRLVGLLCWPGAILYVLYSYLTNLIGVPFGPLFLPYLFLVTLSAYTLIALMLSIDAEVVRRRLEAEVPARAAAVVLMGFSGLFMVNVVVEVVRALTEGTAVGPLELMLWIADTGTIIPMAVAASILLLRRKALGYTAAPGLLLAYTLLFFGLLPVMVYPALHDGLPVDGVGMVLMLAFGLVCLFLFYRFVRAASAAKRGQAAGGGHRPNATRVTATTVGLIFGLSGVNHGFFEFLQGNRPTEGLVIQAIGEAQRFWPLGTEEAFTIIPNFLISGLLSMGLGVVIVIWSLRYLESRHGTKVFLALFVLLFLVGGGIGQVAFFVPAWAFATRMDKPLNWWCKVLPQRSWPLLSRLWPVTLILSTITMLSGLQIAIFGFVPGMTDPERIQSTAMALVFTSAVLYVFTFVAGIGHELQRRSLMMLTKAGTTTEEVLDV